jgi:hypothetical protein
VFLEALRSKQKYVLWALVIVIVPSFIILFGQSRADRASGGRKGERIYDAGSIDGKTITNAMLSRTRVRLAPFIRGTVEGFYLQQMDSSYGRIPDGRSRDWQDQHVLDYMAFRHLKYIAELEHMGIDAGSEEITALVNRVMARSADRRGADRKPSPEELKSFLGTHGLTESEFREGAREVLMMMKYRDLLFADAQVSDASAYVSWAVRNARYVCAWRDFIEDDFTGQVKDPPAPDVNAYWEKHKNDQPGSADALADEPCIRLAWVRAAAADFPDIGPISQDDLLSYYVSNRDKRYRRDLQPIDAAAPPALRPLVYKPFREVEADVAMKVREKRRQTAAHDVLRLFIKDYAARRQALDVLPEIIRDRGFIHEDLVRRYRLKEGETTLLTATQLKSGAETGVGKLERAVDQFMDVAPEGGEFRAKMRAQYANVYDDANTVDNDEGAVVVRVADYKVRKLNSFDEAKPLIVKRLREQALKDLLDRKAKDYERELKEKGAMAEGALVTGPLSADADADEAGSMRMRSEMEVVRSFAPNANPFMSLQLMGADIKNQGDTVVETLRDDPDDLSRKKGRRAALFAERVWPSYAEFLQDRRAWAYKVPGRLMGTAIIRGEGDNRRLGASNGTWMSVASEQQGSIPVIGYAVNKGMQDLFNLGVKNEFNHKYYDDMNKKEPRDKQGTAPESPPPATDEEDYGN